MRLHARLNALEARASAQKRAEEERELTDQEVHQLFSYELYSLAFKIGRGQELTHFGYLRPGAIEELAKTGDELAVLIARIRAEHSSLPFWALLESNEVPAVIQPEVSSA